MVRIKTSFGLTLVALVATILAAMAVGKYHIDLATLGRLFTDLFNAHKADSLTAPALVLWTVRLPRILMAILTGAALSVAGVVFQALFKNPLVSPSILGVTSGANFGAAIALLWFGGSATLLQGSAFIWGLLAVGLTCLIGKHADNSITALVLAGVIVSALFMAGLSYIKCKADPLGQLPAIVFWTMGSFTSVVWKDAAWGVGLILPGLLLIHFFRWGLNPMALGKEEALALGIDVSLRRAIHILIATLMVAAATATCGSIGWVGLVIPHMARMIVGADHDVLVPFAALLGGIFMLLMDTLARVLPGGEIPVGILTAIVGAPCFGYLLLQGKRNPWGE